MIDNILYCLSDVKLTFPFECLETQFEAHAKGGDILNSIIHMHPGDREMTARVH